MCLNHPDSIPLPLVQWKTVFHKTGEVQWSQSCSVMSNSLQPPGLYSPWNSPGQNTEVGSCFLLQGIFPAQESTYVSHISGTFFTSWATREAKNTGVGSLSLLQWILLIQESNQGLLDCRQILYQLRHQGSPWNWSLCQKGWGPLLEQIIQFKIIFESTMSIIRAHTKKRKWVAS